MSNQIDQTRMLLRRRRQLLIGGGIAGLLVALAGCALQPSPETDYSATVDGGKIASITYTFLDGANGAMGYTEHPKAASWTATQPGGHSPSLTVTPVGDGTAHCLLTTSDTNKTVLDEQTGKPGVPVTCRATAS